MLPENYFEPNTIWIYDTNIPSSTVAIIQRRAENSLPVVAGENFKSLTSVGEISEKILALRTSRPLRLVSVGGGACGDAIGFVASILWRGIDLIHVPTTLLAMIDSSIGGKTAVNLGTMKNQLGSFYRAQEIILDSKIIDSLPAALKREGRAEMLKSAWLDSEDCVKEISQLGSHSTTSEWASAIQRIAEFKKRIVAQDPYDDQDIRIQLNFGHSVAHGIERLLHLSHGEAVAWGLLAAARIGRKFGLNDSDSDALFKQASQIIRPHGALPKLHPAAFEKILLRDKKRKNGKLRSVIVTSAGQFEIRDDVTAQDWFNALQESYAILDQPLKLRLGEAKPISVRPPLSKSEQIRVLTYPSQNGINVTIDNDDTFYAKQIFQTGSQDIHAGEGATGFRFAAIQAAFTGKVRNFEVANSLANRKHDELWALFEQENIIYKWGENHLQIDGKSATSVNVSLGTQSTSHIASGIALLCAHDIEVSIEWDEIASFPYFEMTLSLLEESGATIERSEKSVHIKALKNPTMPTVDLDAGAYAFWIILGRLGIPVEILGNIDAKRQPDFRIESLLDQIDASDSCTLDLNASPDLGPVLASYAAVKGKNLTITGAQHLRNKESNRIEDYLDLIGACGIECEGTRDGFAIYAGHSTLASGRVHCCGDHRLVMAAAVLSTSVDITLSGPMCVSKSYWNFWLDLRRSGFLIGDL